MNIQEMNGTLKLNGKTMWDRNLFVSQSRERVMPAKDIYPELDIQCLASAT